MIALMVAAQCPTGVRAVAVGDAPLSSKTWHKILYESRERLATWRELAGGQKPLHDLIKILKDSPVGVPDISEAVSMREVFGEESPVFEWLATNLSQNDPDMLSALIDRFQTTAAGYEEETVLPAIGCPVLLMQADPSVGGLMTDGEIAKALPLLAHPRHVKLDGVSHILHNERKDPILEALALFFQS
jgi:pimeloyl-ACP methyl ester carboxylesterase